MKSHGETGNHAVKSYVSVGDSCRFLDGHFSLLGPLTSILEWLCEHEEISVAIGYAQIKVIRCHFFFFNPRVWQELESQIRSRADKDGVSETP